MQWLPAFPSLSLEWPGSKAIHVHTYAHTDIYAIKFMFIQVGNNLSCTLYGIYTYRCLFWCSYSIHLFSHVHVHFVHSHDFVFHGTCMYCTHDCTLLRLANRGKATTICTCVSCWLCKHRRNATTGYIFFTLRKANLTDSLQFNFISSQLSSPCCVSVHFCYNAEYKFEFLIHVHCI
jgi:hypothetical protein